VDVLLQLNFKSKKLRPTRRAIGIVIVKIIVVWLNLGSNITKTTDEKQIISIIMIFLKLFLRFL
jgi:hypothetical protein